MRAALLAAVVACAACGPATDSPAPGVSRLAAQPEAHGFAVSPDFASAAWVEGVWPDRTRLVTLALATGRRAERRLKGFNLVEAAYAPDGALKVLARKVGASDGPGSPPRRAAILTVPPGGGEPVVEDVDGAVVGRRPVPWHVDARLARQYPSASAPDLLVRGPRRTVWTASLSADGSSFLVESFDEETARRLTATPVPGPVESLLPGEDTLYLLTRSSDSLPSAAGRGPRLLTKVDLTSGRASWSVPWAPRPSALLARDPGGVLYAAVTDPEAPSLWSFSDRADAATAAGRAAAAPDAAAARGRRTAVHFFARLLPALLLAGAVLILRR